MQCINLIRLIGFRFPWAAIYFRCNAEFNRGSSSDVFGFCPRSPRPAACASLRALSRRRSIPARRT
ncbi:hypothetical protein HYPGJ_31638 [Hyphomicrobium sp. GJ21]|nr:hypothetical protein HYPGJ_31638 [Hyphomicrobium sp. GJ21]